LISKQTIAHILEDARIEEVIGEFVKLKKSGQNYKGLSPFTDERNPSFYVSPAKGIFKCFSSGKGGNVVNFLMEHEHFTYPEALIYLARKYGIAIEEDAVSPEESQAETEREALFQVTAFAQKYFTDTLFNTDAGRSIGLEYFKGRDFREDTIRKFQLGFSPEAWDAFTRHALDNAYNSKYLEAAGLSIRKDDRLYDRFRGRVIFPIHNISGRVMGFGGRTLLKDDHVPKYVNSPESDIYNKSQVLYGLYFAKSAIIRADNCLLVEGYTDVISLHQAGIENVVASSGTALTDEQVRLIKRYTLNVTILYDGDPAGIKASFRGIDMVLEQGMNVRIVLFPDGEDPDSFARKHRRVDLEDLISKGAQDFIRFKTSLLLKEAAGDPIRRAALIKEIVGSISLIPDPIYRSVYIKECSNLLEVAEQTLMSSLNRMLWQKNKRQAEQQASRQEVDYPEEFQVRQVEPDSNHLSDIESYLVYLLLCYGSHELKIPEGENILTVKASQIIINEMVNDEISFANPTFQEIFNDYMTRSTKEQHLDERSYINHDNQEIAAATSRLLNIGYQLANWERHRRSIRTELDRIYDNVTKTILTLKLKTVENRINLLTKRISETDDFEDSLILISQKKDLDSIWNLIRKALGRE
jgi:DNA primase